MLPLTFVPQVLDDNHRLPDETQIIDWPPVQSFEQSNFQAPEPSQANSLLPVNIEPPDLSPFGNTEDFLQYIFPSPQDGEIPFSPDQDPFATAGEASPPQVVFNNRRGNEQPDDSSPPALLQLNAMIHDSVSFPS